MKVLIIGDVFGKPGRRAVSEIVPGLISGRSVDFVVANGENLAGGKGLTPETCEQLFSAGVDVITSGNHVRDKKEIDPLLEGDSRVLRPLNYPATMPGRGGLVRKSRKGVPVGVVNAIGRVHMGEIDSPFLPTKKCVEELRLKTPIVIVDFHAEATSEKRAMGWFLNGLASAVLGTHTHVQTADEQILSYGTAYLTDLGMTGPHDSVIGLRTDLALERFVSGKRGAFDVGKGDIQLNGALIDVDEVTGRALSIERVHEKLSS